jgi:hypothetical protein
MGKTPDGSRVSFPAHYNAIFSKALIFVNQTLRGNEMGRTEL